MALFILLKLILPKRMCSHPVGLDAWLLIGPFVYFHTLCVWSVKALARPRGCAGSPEPLLVACVINTIISWAGSNRNEPFHKKTCLRGLQLGKTQTGLLIYRSWLGSWNFGYIYRYHTIWWANEKEADQTVDVQADLLLYCSHIT